MNVASVLDRRTTIPILALGMLLVLPTLCSHELIGNEDTVRRNARIREAFDNVPHRIGEWEGENVEVPKSAEEILNPTASLSRRYRKLGGGPRVDLVIVHCSDVRDMQGHYPPRCYPFHGWQRVKHDREPEYRVSVVNDEVPMRIYHFGRRDSWGEQKEVRVYNCLILPDGEVTSDLSVVSRRAQRYSLSGQGIAQIQVVTPGNMSPEASAEAVRELLTGTSSLLEVLGHGVQNNDRPESAKQS